MRGKLFFWITVFVFIPTVFPLLQGWIPIFARTWVFAGLMIIAILLYVNKGVKQRFILPFYLYFTILVFDYLLGDFVYNNVTQVIMNFAFFFCSSMAFYYYVNYSTLKQQCIFLGMFGCVLFITMLATFMVFQTNPDVLRDIQSDINVGGDLGLRHFYNKLGVESYEMGHALCCLSPVLIFNIRTKLTSGMEKLLNLLLLCVVCMLVYMSTATTALLFLAMLILISIILPCGSLKGNKKFVFVFLLPLFFLIMSLIVEWLLQFWLINAEGKVAVKATEIMAFYESGEKGASVESRESLYLQSIEAFFRSPIWGVNNGTGGGHSVFLDTLATMGLIGTVPLVLFLYRYYIFVKRNISNELRPFFLLSYMGILLMSLLKAISGFEYWSIQLFVMPLFYLNASQRMLFGEIMQRKVEM